MSQMSIDKGCGLVGFGTDRFAVQMSAMDQDRHSHCVRENVRFSSDSDLVAALRHRCREML
jgi:hypothetical protein